MKAHVLGKYEIGGEALVRANLGGKTSLVPTFFSRVLFSA